ncbi:hypothetical protein TA3x_001918 [Tundrisphaera sp. TA3]|uniref:hypothetical protein n=1 Tax=Tundrisphaera sp. TA3 TaxID=3435775 RepID=UPI003EB90FBF
MISIVEKSLRFDFPDDWDATKFDEWSYYRGQFSRVGDAKLGCNTEGCSGIIRCPICQAERVAGNRGVDIVAIDPQAICWLIEIKDYRSTRETRFAPLAEAVTLKVRDTLGCLSAARLNASGGEREIAQRAISCTGLRIVLHLETPPTHSPLLAPAKQRADVLQRLRQFVKPIDPRPRVVSMTDREGLPWSVTEV